MSDIDYKDAITFLGGLKLPCDVRLAPATLIGQGCSFETLLRALQLRTKVEYGEESKRFTTERVPDGYVAVPSPIPMVLHCPKCGAQHVDAPEPEHGWTNPPHKSHLCHGCGTIWRPAMVSTCGVTHLEREGERDTWRPIVYPYYSVASTEPT